jgi:hypothetical protein
VKRAFLTLLVVLSPGCGSDPPDDVVGPAPDVREPAPRTAAPPALGPTTFMPEAEHRGERDVLRLTFPDGRHIALSYPAELGLADLGVQPDVSYYLDDRGGPYRLTFLYRSPEPEARKHEIVLRAGEWTVVVPVPDPAARDDVATSLSIHETADGFVVVEAATPLTLSGQFGEGGGAQLALGDHDPHPKKVTPPQGTLIHLAPVDDCGWADGEISEVGSPSYGATCLGGRIFFDIYGKRPLIEAVLSGLELE